MVVKREQTNPRTFNYQMKPKGQGKAVAEVVSQLKHNNAIYTESVIKEAFSSTQRASPRSKNDEQIKGLLNPKHQKQLHNGGHQPSMSHFMGSSRATYSKQSISGKFNGQATTTAAAFMRSCKNAASTMVGTSAGGS